MSSMTATTIALGSSVWRSKAGIRRARRGRMAWANCRWFAGSLQAAEQILLLRLVFLGADRAAIAQVGEVAERAGDLVRRHLAGCGHRRRRDGFGRRGRGAEGRRRD